MIRNVVAVSLMLALVTIGAEAQSVKKDEEREVLPATAPGTSEDLTEQIRSLERSVVALRSELGGLRVALKSLQARPPLTAHKLPKDVSLCGERIPLEDRKARESLEIEFLVSLGNEAQVLLWMKRAKRYFPHIEKRLKEMFLPDDLKYMTITESSLRSYAVSPTGAAGIWQFIPSTGEKYGMRKGGGLDERFDFVKATEGAMNYLKDLFEEFKSWPLALAAYNAGENRIRKEVALQGTNDYVFLDLPIETERYVYKIAVAKIILSSPEKYGFRLDPGELYDPLEEERISLELPAPLPLVDVAKSLGLSYKELKEMNLHVSGEAIPAGTHILNLPPGTSPKFWAFFSRWRNEISRNVVAPSQRTGDGQGRARP